MGKMILTRYNNNKKRQKRANTKSSSTISVLRILRVLDKKGLVNKDDKRIKT